MTTVIYKSIYLLTYKWY